MTTLLQRGRRGERLDDLDIVDMHGHLGRSPFGVPDLSPASLVAGMDRLGVATCVCSHTHCMYAGPSDANAEVLDAIRAFPGRIAGYLVLWPSGADDVRRQAERYLDAGFAGVKLHDTTGFRYTDPAYAPALAMADERRMPVLLHTWARAEQFEEVRRLATAYPRANFILAHSGVAGSIDAYGRLAREHANVHLDLCMSLTPCGHVERLVEAAGVDKVLWGSDALFLNMAHQLGKVLAARIGDDDKRRLLSANARRILGRET
ncbi:MAG: amidohydrolase [Planctomycetes bacterium]|nr:amidohydrolase [Planctomycetota bacterium]